MARNGWVIVICVRRARRPFDLTPFNFAQLIAYLKRVRSVRAGSILGSGAVTNPDGMHGMGLMRSGAAVGRASTVRLSW